MLQWSSQWCANKTGEAPCVSAAELQQISRASAVSQLPFRHALVACLRDAEQCAVAEVGRLENALAELRWENASLADELRTLHGRPRSPKSSFLPKDGACRTTPISAAPCAVAAKARHSVDRQAEAQTAAAERGEAAPAAAPPRGNGVQRGLSALSAEDPVELKHLMRKIIEKPVYNVEDLYKTEGMWQSIARSNAFSNITLAIITLNAVWMAIEVDQNDASKLQDADWPFQVMEHGFCTYFSWELLVRAMSFRNPARAFTDAWFAFDVALVSMMVLETWCVPLVMAIAQSDGSLPLGDAAVLRLLRLLRLTRITRMMRMMPEMMVMVAGLLAGIRSVFFASCLMAAMIYVFAIMLRQLTDGSEVGEEHFGSVPSAAYTLLIEGMMPDNGSMMTDLGCERWYLGIIFFAFVFLAALTIMNMLVGILCDVVSGVSEAEKEEMEVQMLAEELNACLSLLDENYDGLVSKAEVIGILNQPAAIKSLQSAGVDVFGLIDNAETIFHAAGKENLEFAEFIEVLTQFRASHGATIKSISDLRKFMHKHSRKMESTLEQIELRMAQQELAHTKLANDLLCHVRNGTGDTFLPLALAPETSMLSPTKREL